MNGPLNEIKQGEPGRNNYKLIEYYGKGKNGRGILMPGIRTNAAGFYHTFTPSGGPDQK
jgi:hypothetical protein